MNTVVVTLLSAAVISAIITAMSQLKSARSRALLYSLPIPISVALLATNAPVNSLSIFGTLLVVSFIWGVYFAHHVLRWPILLADVTMALLYVALAYVIAHNTAISFAVAATGYAVLWLFTMVLVRNVPLQVGNQKKSTTPPALKAAIVFLIAYMLFSAKAYLAAFVVTFPYSGVFAVYESKHSLQSLALLFTRNSIAIWGLFVAYSLLVPHMHRFAALLVSWVFYVAILWVVTKLVPFAKTA